MSKIVIISGPSASGKTTLAHALAPLIGARVINAGDIVLSAVLAIGLTPRSRADAGGLFLESFGEKALGPLLERRASAIERVIIDGLRLPDARDLLVDRATSSFHIHLQVSQEVRLNRLKLRNDGTPFDNVADSFSPWMKRCANLVIANERADVWQSVASHYRLCDAYAEFAMPARHLINWMAGLRHAPPKSNFQLKVGIGQSSTLKDFSFGGLVRAGLKVGEGMGTHSFGYDCFDAPSSPLQWPLGQRGVS